MNDYWEALHWSISSGRLFPFALGLSAVMAMAGVAAIYRLRGKTYEQWSSLNIDAQRPVFTGIVIALALLYPSMSMPIPLDPARERKTECYQSVALSIQDSNPSPLCS